MYFCRENKRVYKKQMYKSQDNNEVCYMYTYVGITSLSMSCHREFEPNGVK